MGIPFLWRSGGDLSGHIGQVYQKSVAPSLAISFSNNRVTAQVGFFTDMKIHLKRSLSSYK
jgi:hypothetical protein